MAPGRRSTLAAGGPTKQMEDPRNVREKGFVRQSLQRLIEFLVENNSFQGCEHSQEQRWRLLPPAVALGLLRCRRHGLLGGRRERWQVVDRVVLVDLACLLEEAESQQHRGVRGSRCSLPSARLEEAEQGVGLVRERDPVLGE